MVLRYRGGRHRPKGRSGGRNLRGRTRTRPRLAHAYPSSARRRQARPDLRRDRASPANGSRGSESSSHRTTRRSNLGSCPPGVSFAIRRFLPALVEGRRRRSDHRPHRSPWCSSTPMRSILGSEPPHQTQSEEGRSPRRPRSCHEPQVLWRGSPSNSGGLWAGQGPIPKGPPRKGTTPPAAPAASAGPWARTPRAARPLATRPRPKRPARRAAAAPGSAHGSSRRSSAAPQILARRIPVQP